MSNTPRNKQSLNGREFLGGRIDLLSAWFALGRGLVEAWRTLDAKEKRARARPLVQALVRRCNQHRQAAWLEFVLSCKKWHYKSREGHFTLISPRSLQDKGRRRAEPFNELAALKLLSAYRKGTIQGQDALWVMDAFCYAVATAVPGAKESVTLQLPAGPARSACAEAQRQFGPHTDCWRQPLPQGLLRSLREFIISEDGRIGRFNRIWRNHLERKAASYAPRGPVQATVAWLVEQLDPNPDTPKADLAAFCQPLIALGQFGQQLRIQFPPSAGTPGKVQWTDRLSRNLIRLGKLAELVQGDSSSQLAVEIDYLGLAPAPVEDDFESASPSIPAQETPLSWLPGLPEEEPAEAEAVTPGPGHPSALDLPELPDEFPEFDVLLQEPARALEAGEEVEAESGGTARLRERTEAPTLAGGARSATATIVFQCASCGKRLGVPAVSAGRRFRCPGCATESRIPAASEAATTLPPAPAPPDPPLRAPTAADDTPSSVIASNSTVEPSHSWESPPEEPERPRRRKSRRKKRSQVDEGDAQASSAGRSAWRRVRRGLRVVSFALIAWMAAVALTLLASLLIPVLAGGTSRLGTLGNDLHTAEETGRAGLLSLIALTSVFSLVNFAQVAGYSLCLAVPSRRDAVGWCVVALLLTVLGGGLYAAGLVWPILAFVAIFIELAGWIAFLFFLRAVGDKLDVKWILQEITSLTHFFLAGGGAASALLVGLFIFMNQVTDPQRGEEGVPTVLLFGIVANIILFVVLLVVVLFRYLQVLRDTSAAIEETASRPRPVVSASAAVADAP